MGKTRIPEIPSFGKNSEFRMPEKKNSEFRNEKFRV